MQIQISYPQKEEASVSVFRNHCSFLRMVLLFIRYTYTVQTCRTDALSYLPPPLTVILPRYTQQLPLKFRYLSNTGCQPHKIETFLLTTVKNSEHL